MTPGRLPAPLPVAERIHAMDAVRAFALVLGVFLHATISFFPPAPVTVWPVADSTSSHSLALGFYVIHMFRMLLFFLLAGYFARLLLLRDGVAGFSRDRMRRVVVPFAIGMLVLPPLTSAVGFLAPRGAFVVERLPVLMHLWFLYLLAILYAGLVIIAITWRVAPASARRTINAAGDAVADSALLPLAAAIPGAVALYSLPSWAAWFGIPAPGWFPNRAAMVAYGTAVAAGWLLHRRPLALRDLRTRWRIYFAVGVLCAAGCLAMVGVRPQYVIAGGGPATAAYALLYSLGGWTLALAIVGVGLRIVTGANAAIRFMADASFWVYLTHLPVVLLLQTLLAPLALNWRIKFIVVIGVSLPLLFGSYYLLTVAKARVGWRASSSRRRSGWGRRLDPPTGTPVISGQ